MKTGISAILLLTAGALPLAACDKSTSGDGQDQLANDEAVGDSTEAAADRAMMAAEKAIDASASAAKQAGDKVGTAAGRAGAAVGDATKDAVGSASEQADRIAADAKAE
ncbi:hypothetical protein [Flavisphingopyxis soli]|nr:hypothetical protein [Sphingorhabdus soli]